MNPVLSVILPVYNVENYLEECLDSLLNQTYSNFEIIAVNDGSTDNSLQILLKYKLLFKKMIIISQENSGLSSARNTGIEQCSGTYIYFLDSDDYISKNTFEKVIDIFKETDVDLIKFDATPFSDDPNFNVDLNEYNSNNIYQTGKIYEKSEFLSLIEKKYQAPVWLYIFKADILKLNNLSFRPDLLHEDELFTPKLLVNCNKFYYINEQFFKRRYRKGSIMTTQNNEKSILNYNIIINDLYNYSEIFVGEEKKFLINRLKGIYYTSCCLSINYTNKYCGKLTDFGTKLTFKQNIKLFIKRLVRINK